MTEEVRQDSLPLLTKKIVLTAFQLFSELDVWGPVTLRTVSTTEGAEQRGKLMACGKDALCENLAKICR